MPCYLGIQLLSINVIIGTESPARSPSEVQKKIQGAQQVAVPLRGK